jgi:8-hydroxy-5-deazaflavin:NADPH oxidoreductase
MNVTIIGTGKMARGIATRLLAGGHSVTLVGRETSKATELAISLTPAAKQGARVLTARFGAPIADPIVILAVWYSAAASIVQQYGAQLAGKILIDITNPLNATYDGLATAPDTSAAEEIAKVAPADTIVLKAFNTTFAGTLVAGQVAGQPLDVFIAGDDAEAKATVSRLVTDGGLRAIDVGPLRRARQLEGLGLLGITLQGPLGTGFMSAWKILS